MPDKKQRMNRANKDAETVEVVMPPKIVADVPDLKSGLKDVADMLKKQAQDLKSSQAGVGMQLALEDMKASLSGIQNSFKGFNVEKIGASFQKVGDDLKAEFELFRDGSKAFGQWSVDTFKSGMEKLGTKMDDIKNNTSVKAFTEAVQNGFQKVVGYDFKELFSETMESVKNIGGKIKDGLSGMAGRIKDKGMGVWEKVRDKLIELGAMILSIVASIGFFKGLENATKWFGENATFGEKIASVLVTFFGSLLGLTDEEQKNVAKFLGKMFNGIFKWIEDLFTGLFVGAKEIVQGFISGDTQRIIGGVRKIVTTITDAIFGIGDAILSTIFGPEKSAAILQPLKDAVQKILDIGVEIFNIFKNVWGLITGEGGSWGQLFDSFKNIGSKLLGIADDLIKSVMAAFNLGDWYAKAKQTVVDTFYSVINAVIDFINGITKYIPGVDAIKRLGPTEEEKKAAAELAAKPQAPAPGTSNAGAVAMTAKEVSDENKRLAARAPAPAPMVAAPVVTNNTQNTNNQMVVPFRPKTVFSSRRPSFAA